MINHWLGSTSIAVVLSLAALPAAAQNQLWIYQIGTSGHDSISAAAVDGAGGVFVGGVSSGNVARSSKGDLDAWLLRFDAFGHRVAGAQVGTDRSDVLSAVATDSSGGAFICGGSLGDLGAPSAGMIDAWLARCDGSGTVLWTRQLGSSDSDWVSAAATDGVGGVFVCGTTEGSLGAPLLGFADAWVARFDDQGNQAWLRQFGAGIVTEVYAAAPGNSGGVFVCGYTYGDLGASNAGGADAWIAYFDGAGIMIWVRQIGTTKEDQIKTASSDGMGGVFVGGYTGGSLASANLGQSDAWAAHYDALGNGQWTIQIGTPGTDAILGSATDNAGGLLVTGITGGSLGGMNAGALDVWLARIDGAGSVLWLDQFGTPNDDRADAAGSVGLDALFIAGSTLGTLAGQNSGAQDAWLARYDGSCNSGETYCTASTTSIPNCQAAISASGSPTLADPTAHTISSGPVPGANLGLLLFGSSGSASTPYGALGGMLCVAVPTFRTTPKLSGGDQGECNGAYAFTLQDLINASPIVTSGATIHAEIWARDPANQDGFLLSDGLRFTVCP
jgi:hypothetical protein